MIVKTDDSENSANIVSDDISIKCFNYWCGYNITNAVSLLFKSCIELN